LFDSFSLLKFAILFVSRMNDANVQLTQVVSQLTGPAVISVADDLLQTQRMTIEDLIESTEVVSHRKIRTLFM
jgi:hypothetical protein